MVDACHSCCVLFYDKKTNKEWFIRFCPDERLLLAWWMDDNILVHAFWICAFKAGIHAHLAGMMDGLSILRLCMAAIISHE